MRREAGEAEILCPRIHVIDQQTNPHTAIGGLEELLDQVHPGRVVVPYVGLHVQGTHGQACGMHPHRERFRTVNHETKRGLTGMLRLDGRDRPIERTIFTQRDHGIEW